MVLGQQQAVISQMLCMLPRSSNLGEISVRYDRLTYSSTGA